MSEHAIKAQGSDIEEAIQNGLKRLGLGRTDVIIDVVDEGRKGLLGLGSREAVVRLTPLAAVEYDDGEAEVDDEPPAAVEVESASVVPEMEPAEVVEPAAAPAPEPEPESVTVAADASPAEAAPALSEPEPVQEEETEEAPLPADAAPALPEAETDGAEVSAAAESALESAEEEEEEEEEEEVEVLAAGKDTASAPPGADAEVAEAAQGVVETLLEKMGFTGAGISVDYGEPDDRTGRVMTIVEIDGGSALNSLIGPHGDVLGDLQYITRLMTGHVIKRRANFLLDVNGYRRRREEALAKLAERMAGKAVRRGEPVTLEAMNAYDRRIIHIALRDNEEVYTNSVGEGADRRVRIYVQE